MDINAKHSITHSHTWDMGPYIHHSNLANCKFTLVLLVLVSYAYTRQKICSKNPLCIAIMAHVIYAEPSVNQREVRLQRRTQLIVNHSQLNRAPENVIETMINLHSVYNRGSYTVVINCWHRWLRIDTAWRGLSGWYTATTTVMVCLDLCTWSSQSMPQFFGSQLQVFLNSGSPQTGHACL